MKVAIIGCGNLGSRHAESLAKHKDVESISIVDPSDSGLRITLDRIMSTGYEGSISCFKNLSDVSGPFDLAVISTSSAERLKSLDTLIQNADPKNVLLEKLLAANAYDLAGIRDIASKSLSRFWVNCPMPFFSHYQTIQENCAIKHSSTPLEYSVRGSNFGLVSNSIHYLDHFSVLTGRQVEQITLEPDCSVIDSKRTGYKELIGRLTAQTDSGDVLRVSYSSQSDPQLLEIEISNGEDRWLVNEIDMHIQHFRNGESAYSSSIVTPFQSDLTHKSLERIKLGESPMWGDFATSLHLHKLLFEAISGFFGSTSVPKFT
jgi:predicted dehydrogenase